MTTSRAISIVKGQVPDCAKTETLEAWQTLVDAGTIWNMGEWFSLMASCMIAAGTLERNPA